MRSCSASELREPQISEISVTLCAEAHDTPSLRDLGYTVLHASSGPDVVMPVMTGKALADEARTRMPAPKVLYTTGCTQNAHNGVLDADARLLLKPYTLNDLAKKVRAVLDE